ncbi:MAG: hypothetical protein GY823_12455 [Flavobacteriaceae bacterium]|nr:hypothetical protein [Flavobacteriaceae bacterium]
MDDFLDMFEMERVDLVTYLFTDYKYNILQLAAYFLNLPLIEDIYEDQEIFEALVFYCDHTTDSIWHIAICKGSFQVFSFLFDKLRMRVSDDAKVTSFNNLTTYRHSPLWNINKFDYLEEIFDFYIKKQDQKK